MLIPVLVLAFGSMLSSGVTQAGPSAPAVWKIVVLGDSDATGHGDPTRVGWVGRYAQLLRQKRGLRVTVANLARDGTTSSQLRASVGFSDSAMRVALKEAHIVLIGIGGADLEAGDNRLQGGKCKPEACFAPVMRAFGRNFDATVASIRKLNGSRRFVLRAITPAISVIGAEDLIPPFVKPHARRLSVYQGKAFGRHICRAMTKHGGRCVDVLRPFNGPRGTDNAYKKGLMSRSECCYPTAKGQQLMAELLLKTGLAPLR